MPEAEFISTVTALPQNDQIISRPCPLSESPLWQWLKQYYSHNPETIWPNLPSWISSHRMHAVDYAKLCCAYTKDLIDAGQLAPGDAIYVLDIGAGYGTLSAHLMAALNRAKSEHGLTAYPIRHILLDINPSSLQHWQSLACFDAHTKACQVDDPSGIAIDYVITDTAHIEHARLFHHDKRLGDLMAQHPMVVIAHYLADSLPCDYYHHDPHGQHHSILCQLSTPPQNLSFGQQPKQMRQVHIQYFKKPIEQTVYPEPYLNSCLAAALSKQSKGSYCAFPIAALKLMAWLHSKATAGMLLCIQDKGATEQHGLDELQFGLNANVFSSEVNFGTLKHLMNAWHDHQRPSAVHLATEPACLLAVATVTHPESIPFTLSHAQLRKNCQNAHRASMIDLLENTPATFTLAQQRLLHANCKDPVLIANVLLKHFDVLSTHPSITQALLTCLITHMGGLPQKSRYAQLIARSYQQLGDAESAMPWYQRLPTNLQEAPENLALGLWCHRHAGNEQRAAALEEMLQKAKFKTTLMQLKRHARHIQRWLMLGGLLTALAYFCMLQWG